MYQKQIRRLSEYEIPVALDLAWRVFSEYGEYSLNMNPRITLMRVLRNSAGVCMMRNTCTA